MATRINTNGVHEIQLADGSWVVAVALINSSGAAALGQAAASASMPVVGAKDAIARLDHTYTRVSDTNGYTAGDEISNNVTAGSATPGQLTNAPLVSGGGLLIIGGLLSTSQKTCVAQLRTHFYSAAPTMSGDNVAFGWKLADKLTWLGYIDWDAFSTEDATNSDGAFAMAGSIRLPMVPAATTLYYRHETKTTFTPDSAQSFTMSLFPAR